VSYLPVIEPDILTMQDCRRVMRHLHSLRSAWRERRLGFFTLGANAYQDASIAGTGSAYAEEVGRSNALLAPFGWIYERLTRSLSTMTGLEAVLSDRLCWPGFHIFEESGLSAAGGQIHVDLQYLRLADAFPELASADLVLSITMPVELPAGGGGLNVWPIQAGSSAAARANCGLPGEGWADLRHDFVPYQIGSLYAHSGHFYHQIAGTSNLARPVGRQWRVTLQGHGYVADGRLYLYW